MTLLDLIALTAISYSTPANLLDKATWPNPEFGREVLLPAARAQLTWERMTYA